MGNDEVVALEPNGSRTVRTTHEALAEFGARCLIAVKRWQSDETRALGLAREILHAADAVGLLGESAEVGS